jgi:hypothetical protein
MPSEILPPEPPEAAGTSLRTLEGSEATGAIVNTLTHRGFKPLDDHLAGLGYRRVNARTQAVAMAAPNWDSVQVFVPFQKDENHYASIIHGSSPRGRDDLLAVEADITRLRSLSEADHQRIRSQATKPDGTFDLAVLREAVLFLRGRRGFSGAAKSSRIMRAIFGDAGGPTSTGVPGYLLCGAL